MRDIPIAQLLHQLKRTRILDMEGLQNRSDAMVFEQHIDLLQTDKYLNISITVATKAT